MNMEAEDPVGWQKEEQEKIDTAEPLTEEQQQQKEKLLQEVRRETSFHFTLQGFHIPFLAVGFL